MKKPIAILEKTPFAIDPVPMEGCHSTRAGAGLRRHAGRILRDRCKIRLRLAASAGRIALLIALFKKFPLRTVATG